jgi:hypothetical protein
MRVRDIIKVLDYVAIYEKSQTGRATYVPDLDGLSENRLATHQLSAEAEVISSTER